MTRKRRVRMWLGRFFYRRFVYRTVTTVTGEGGEWNDNIVITAVFIVGNSIRSDSTPIIGNVDRWNTIIIIINNSSLFVESGTRKYGGGTTRTIGRGKKIARTT